MNFTCLAIDFDNCLAYYNDDRAGLFKIFTDIGFSEENARMAYKGVDDTVGVSLNSISSSLEKIAGVKINAGDLKNKFDQWIEGAVSVFPDVNQFLSEAKSMGIPITIITYGNDDFQKQKIKISKIIYDDVVVTNVPGGKYLVLGELLKRFGPTIAFVDDKPEELDNVRERFSEKEIGVFRIIRPTGPHIDKKAKFNHPEVKSLFDILK